MNNNFLNSNYFQNTPQKDDKNKGWLVPQPQNTGFGTQPPSTPISSSQPMGFPSSGQMFNTSSGMYGQQPPASPFGINQQPNAASNPMGQGLNPFPAGFGSSAAPFGTTTPSTPFGTSTPSVSFGTNTPANPFGASKPLSSFGAPSTSAFPTTSSWNTGMSTQTSAFPSASPWNTGTTASIPNSWAMGAKGSKVAPYNLTRIKEDTGLFVDIVDITGMKEYSNKHIDEIRKEDYDMALAPPRPGIGGMPNIGLSGTGGMPNIGLSGTGGMPNIGLSGTGGFSPSVSQPSLGFSSSTQQNLSSGMGFSNTSNLFGGPSAMPGTTPSASMLNTNQPSSLNMGQPSSNIFKPFQPTSAFNPSQNLFGNISNPPAVQTTTSPSALSQPTGGFFGSSGTPSTTSATFNNPSTMFTNRPIGSTANDSTLVAPPIFNTELPKQSQQPFTSAFNPFSSNAVSTPAPMNPFGGMASSNVFGTQPSQVNPFQPQAQPQAPLQQPVSSHPATSFTNLSNIDMSDPYMIKNMKFEKVQQQKPSIKISLPTPIFKTKRDTVTVDLKIRPPKPISRSSVYTIPDLNDLDTSRPIQNLVVGFEGKGRIEYQEPVVVKSLEDIERQILFRNENVEINDAIDTGLNKKARVYVEGLFPVSRATNEIIKGRADSFPQKGIQERFIYQLKNDSTKKFIDYDVDNGIYIYEVNHF